MFSKHSIPLSKHFSFVYPFFCLFSSCHVRSIINGGTWEEVSKGTITKCVNGFGTYDQILKDLRLPTMEARRWEAVNKEELPIPGTLYNQYTIDYCVDRGILGTDAVGNVVKSLTHHVFFVPQALASTFEGKLTTAGITDLLDKNGKKIGGE